MILIMQFLYYFSLCYHDGTMLTGDMPCPSKRLLAYDSARAFPPGGTVLVRGTSTVVAKSYRSTVQYSYEYGTCNVLTSTVQYSTVQ